MDYRRLIKAGIILVLGIFMGKPIMSALDGAVSAYQDGQDPIPVHASKDAG